MMVMMMITKGYGVRATTIDDQKFHVTDGQNTRDQIRMTRFRVIKGPKAHDQIAFCVFHSFLIKSKRMLATYMRCTCNNNLEIRLRAPPVARNYGYTS